MDAQDYIARDVKRFDDANAAFERTAMVLSFVSLFLAIWVRAPGLQINPASVVGLSISGFNVGHAIAFGPIVTSMTAAIYLSHVNRRSKLKAAVMSADKAAREVPAAEGAPKPETSLSKGDELALNNFRTSNEPLSFDIAVDRTWRTVWYFILPPVAGLACLIRYCDFVPNEAAKAGDSWDRIKFLFFNSDSWNIRPILPSHAIESVPGLMEQLPYIYGPLQSLIELGLVIAATIFAILGFRRYFWNENIAP